MNRLISIHAAALTLILALAGTGAALERATPSTPLDSGGAILGVSKKSSGAVTITLTPKRLRGDQLEVETQVDTHTVGDLHKYDLLKMTALVHDGNRVRPVAAPKLEGHHSSGKLVFPLRTLPKAFSIEIRGLDEPALRVLSWP